jgi:hypothetical protein
MKPSITCFPKTRSRSKIQFGHFSVRYSVGVEKILPSAGCSIHFSQAPFQAVRLTGLQYLHLVRILASLGTQSRLADFQ